jgi:hypothetical protein
MNDYEIDYVDGSRIQLLLYQNYLYTKHGKYYMCRNKDCKLLVKLTVSDGEVLVEPRDPKHGHFQVTDCEIACLKSIQKIYKMFNIYKELIKVYHFKLPLEKIQLTMVADGISLKLRENLKKSTKLKVAYIAKSLELYDYMQ